MNIRIYLKNSTKALKAVKRKGIYLLACKNAEGREITSPASPLILNASSPWLRTEAMLLIEALKRVKVPCTIELYTENTQLDTLLHIWIPKWETTEWRKKDGLEVPEIYKTLSALAKPHEINVTVARHEYTSWMETQLRGENTCLTDLETLTLSKRSTGQQKD